MAKKIRYKSVEGWRGRITRQPGQIRKEAALTRIPMRVIVQSSTFSLHI